MTRFFLLVCVAAWTINLSRAAEDQAATGSKTNSAAAKEKIYPSIGTIERLDPALDKLIAPNAFIEKLARGFQWAEGPVWDRRTNALYFSDVPQNVVFKWQP